MCVCVYTCVPVCLTVGVIAKYRYKAMCKYCVCFENGNVLLFQLQLETYLPTFRLDVLAILRVRIQFETYLPTFQLEHLTDTSEDKFSTEVERREHYHFHRVQIQLRNALTFSPVYVLSYCFKFTCL